MGDIAVRMSVLLIEQRKWWDDSGPTKLCSLPIPGIGKRPIAMIELGIHTPYSSYPNRPSLSSAAVFLDQGPSDGPLVGRKFQR